MGPRSREHLCFDCLASPPHYLASGGHGSCIRDLGRRPTDATPPQTQVLAGAFWLLGELCRLTWQDYFEQFIRARLGDLAARQASGRELIERLRAIAADYKLFLFDDKSRF
jgi:hypothetical protein